MSEAKSGAPICCNAGPACRSAHAGYGASIRVLDIIPVHVIRRRVFHHARDVGDEGLAVAGAAEKMEADLHAGIDAAAGDDAAGIDHAGAADPAFRRDLGEAVDRDLAHGGGFKAVGLLPIGRGLAVEEAHAAVDPASSPDERSEIRGSYLLQCRSRMSLRSCGLRGLNPRTRYHPGTRHTPPCIPSR